MQPFVSGIFVWTLDRNGIGQVVDSTSDEIRVRFFRSPRRTFESTYAVGSVRRAYLSPQTRVYVVGDSGRWRIGRVVRYFLDERADPQSRIRYDVQFPNRVSEELFERDLNVRCLLPPDDPATVLANSGIETQFFFDARKAALECVAQNRSAGHGLTGLLSASVELLPHQVEVIRRILQDPIQRYLLADEVGLGKTIEAGAVIRQVVIDDPDEQIGVLAPTSLCWQWERELRDRFFLASENVTILPHEEMRELEPGEIGTLVIDEAHHLITDDPQADPDYQYLESLARSATRVLLISATPVLGNEDLFLALLHLLDPNAYPFDSGVAFAERVRNRQEFGRLLLALNPDMPAAFLRNTLAKTRELFPDDEILRDLTERASDPNLDQRSSVMRMQRHIADTYRLHQRLVRTRRRDLPEWVLSPRRGGITLEEDDDDRSVSMADALDSWRQRALEHVVEDPAGLLTTRLAGTHARLVQALGVSIEECADLAMRLVKAAKTDGENFPGEIELLDRVQDASEEGTLGTRQELVSQVAHTAVRLTRTDRRPAKAIVMTSSEDFAAALVETIKATGPESVFRVGLQQTESELTDAIAGFRTERRDAILVGDARAEEGLNLQFATAMVHADLPFDAARIEQRIGRVDRFGRHKFNNELPQWVVVPQCSGPNPWVAWFDILRDTFRVFENSISELQFLLEGLQADIASALFDRGAQGLAESSDRLAQQLADERLRLDEQYALDSRAMIDQDASELFDRLDAADSANRFQPLQRYMLDILHFHRGASSERRGVFNLAWTDRTLVPKQPWEELFSPDVLQPDLTYQRTIATSVRGVRLVRPGLEMVNAIERFLRWDDRGIAFATWRTDPRWDSKRWGTWLGFRLSYLIEPDASALASELATLPDYVNTSAIQRRLDALLPPWTSVIDLGIDGSVVDDDLLKVILSRGYSTRGDATRDYNLGSRQDALFQLIEPGQFQGAVHEISEAGIHSVIGSPEYQDWRDRVASRAMNTLVADNDRLAIRRSRDPDDSSIEVGMRINELLLSAVRQATPKLDGMGLFVVSDVAPVSKDGADPDEGEDED